MINTIKCYGCRDYETEIFDELSQKYDYKLELCNYLLTDKNYIDALGYEIIMVRGNCTLNADSLKKLKEKGLKYILTRTVGYDHLDLEMCKKLGIEVANVPSYSPHAIAELAITLSLMLLRNTAYITNRTKEGDFTISNQMLSREIRNCTVGILGCGRIGCVAGELFKGLQAKVIGYDVQPSEKARKIMKMVSLDDFIKQADIISCHIPYVKGQNDNFIDKVFISKMKHQSILVNTGRGEILDLAAATDAIQKGKLAGLAIDVMKNEKELFFHKWNKGEITNPLYKQLIELYPKVLITPHIASATNEALREMIETSLKNMEEYRLSGNCHNSLNS